MDPQPRYTAVREDLEPDVGGGLRPPARNRCRVSGCSLVRASTSCQCAAASSRAIGPALGGPAASSPAANSLAQPGALPTKYEVSISTSREQAGRRERERRVVVAVIRGAGRSPSHRPCWPARPGMIMFRPTSRTRPSSRPAARRSPARPGRPCPPGTPVRHRLAVHPQARDTAVGVDRQPDCVHRAGWSPGSSWPCRRGAGRGTSGCQSARQFPAAPGSLAAPPPPRPAAGSCRGSTGVHHDAVHDAGHPSRTIA